MPILNDANIDSFARAASTQIDENRLAMLALTLTPNLGPKRIVDAIAQLRTPGQIFELTLTELEGLRFPADAAQFIFDGKARRAAEEEWGKVAQQGATIVTLGCPEYPERLKEIYDPPPVLWVRGEVQSVVAPVDRSGGYAASFALWHGRGGDAVARSCRSGAGCRERNGAGNRYLCAQGRAGGAHAHGSGLGNGIDVIYPKENKKLAEEILATGGTIVSEVPHGNVSGAAEFSAPQSHPQRTEHRRAGGGGGENSGTRVTARCAAEQDRDLYRSAGQRDSKELLDA